MIEYEEFIKEKQQRPVLGLPSHADVSHFSISAHRPHFGNIGGGDLTFSNSNSSQVASEEGSGQFMRSQLHHDEMMLKEEEDIQFDVPFEGEQY